MASNNSDLDRFIRDAMLAGQSRDAIRNALLAAGWTPEQLAGALDDYAEVDFPVPVPKPRASLSSRDAFLYLVLFSLLYFLCYHLGSLLFDQLLGSSTATGTFICHITVWHGLVALLLAFLVAGLVALIGALRAIRIQPAESLREL